MRLHRLLSVWSLVACFIVAPGCSNNQGSAETGSTSTGGRDVAQTDASSGDDGDESQPSSAFPPLDDGGAFPPLDQDASSNAGGDGAAGMPSPLNPVGNVPLASGSSTLPGNTGQGQDETPAAGPGGRQVFELPGSRPAAGLDTSPLVMPEEGTNELLAFIGQIDWRVGAIAQNGVDNEETLNQIGQLLDTKNTALDRLLAPGIDEQTRLQMLSLKLMTLQQMSQIHYPGADEKYLNLLQSMSKDLNPLVLAGSRTRLIEYYAVKLLQTRSDEAFEDLREAMLVPLREREIAPQTVQMVQAVIQQMFTLEERERARALLAEIAPILIDHPDEQLKQVGNAFLDQLTLAELDFDKARIAVYREEEGAIPVLLDRAEQLLTGRPPSLFTLDAAIDAARVLELSHNFAESLQLYQRISQVAAAGDDPIAATTAARSERRAGIRLNLIGQPLELEGKVAGGADFNWAAYRGKVVLVVFWDSEAGPAIDEFDTIRDLRSKYREKGFDVVGVNLDASPIEAERFLSETPVPWVNIVSSDPDRIGFEAPMAIRCGVDVMPFHLLVDREGKVIDMHIYHFRRDLQIQVGLALGIDPSELPERLSGPLQPPGEEGGAANTEGSPEGEAGSPSPGDGEANEGATEGAAESTAPESTAPEASSTEP